MYLKQLNIHHLRNFRETTLQLSPRFNLFIGKNGSGKTSLLEAVYLLATGQSFRTHHAQDFIRTEQPRCCVAGQILRFQADEQAVGAALRVGIQRDRLGGREIHINEQACRTRGELAKLLPIQIMNTESYQLFDLPPKHRRSFLDWGVFHVEPSFVELWGRYQRVLKQRNAAIKLGKGGGPQLMGVWDEELAEVGEKMDALRAQFIEDFTQVFQAYLTDFLDIKPISLCYSKGWREQARLREALAESRGRDLALGYTTVGPHRADFGVRLGEKAVETLLSRGQLKLFVAALMLARHVWLFEKKGCRSVFLLDDLSSELDKGARTRLMEGLQQAEGQVWITAIEEEKAFREALKNTEGETFHVEHGQISQWLGTPTIQL